jgi:hypothetical protein
MARVLVCPSQSGPRNLDVFINGSLYRTLPYLDALRLAQDLRSQANDPAGHVR